MTTCFLISPSGITVENHYIKSLSHAPITVNSPVHLFPWKKVGSGIARTSFSKEASFKRCKKTFSNPYFLTCCNSEHAAHYPPQLHKESPFPALLKWCPDRLSPSHHGKVVKSWPWWSLHRKVAGGERRLCSHPHTSLQDQCRSRDTISSQGMQSDGQKILPPQVGIRLSFPKYFPKEDGRGLRHSQQALFPI